MVRMDKGLAVGAIVTDDAATAGILLERLFDNRMEYDLDHAGDGYLRLRERLTQSVVRLQTGDRMLRETFLQNYKGIV
jgi:hypothetical protein